MVLLVSSIEVNHCLAEPEFILFFLKNNIDPDQLASDKAI